MKIKFVLLTLSLGVVSCSNDDENDNDNDSVEHIITVASIKNDAQFIEEQMPYYVKFEGDKDWRMC